MSTIREERCGICGREEAEGKLAMVAALEFQAERPDLEPAIHQIVAHEYSLDWEQAAEGVTANSALERLYMTLGRMALAYYTLALKHAAEGRIILQRPEVDGKELLTTKHPSE